MEDWKLPEEIVGAGKRFGGRMKGAKNRTKQEDMNNNDFENVKRYKRDREKCRNDNLNRAFGALKCMLGYDDQNLSRVEILKQARSRIEELNSILKKEESQNVQDQALSISMLSSEEFWDMLFKEDEDSFLL